MDLWSSQDAAHRLGLSSRRVRALAGAGKLKAHKIGSRWIFEPVSAVREPHAGRPVSAAIAWAILALLSGDRPDRVHPSALSRLKRRLRDLEWVLRSLQYGEARARVVRWRVLPADIPKILAKRGLVLTGLSAITREIDLVPSSEELDAYVTSDVMRTIERQFQPVKGTRSAQPDTAGAEPAVDPCVRPSPAGGRFRGSPFESRCKGRPRGQGSSHEACP